MTKSELITLPFHGASLVALKGATPADTMVAMKPVVEGMGLDWEGQRLKLSRHPVMKTSAFVTKVRMPGDVQSKDHTFLPLSRLNFWLATIQPDRIKDQSIRAKVIEYQTECADVLFEHFFGKIQPQLDAKTVGGVVKGVVKKDRQENLAEIKKLLQEEFDSKRRVVQTMLKTREKRLLVGQCERLEGRKAAQKLAVHLGLWDDVGLTIGGDDQREMELPIPFNQIRNHAGSAPSGNLPDAKDGQNDPWSALERKKWEAIESLSEMVNIMREMKAPQSRTLSDADLDKVGTSIGRRLAETGWRK